MPIRYEKTQIENDNDPDCHYIQESDDACTDGGGQKQTEDKNIDAKDQSEVPGDTDVTMPEDAQNKEVKLKQTDLETTNEVRGTDILSKTVSKTLRRNKRTWYIRGE